MQDFNQLPASVLHRSVRVCLPSSANTMIAWLMYCLLQQHIFLGMLFPTFSLLQNLSWIFFLAIAQLSILRHIGATALYVVISSDGSNSCAIEPSVPNTLNTSSPFSDMRSFVTRCKLSWFRQGSLMFSLVGTALAGVRSNCQPPMCHSEAHSKAA